MYLYYPLEDDAGYSVAPPPPKCSWCGSEVYCWPLAYVTFYCSITCAVEHLSSPRVELTTDDQSAPPPS